jgi:hypothetical protein
MKQDGIKVLIPDTQFPDNTATDAEKKTEAFGKTVGQAIQHEWFRKGGSGNCSYYSRWTDFHVNRLYSRGEQSIAKYRDELSVNGDTSKLNLDWTILKVMPKFIDLITNGMNDRMFTPKADAVDATSSEDRGAYQHSIEADMVARDFLEQTNSEFGINAFNSDPNELPENDQELELHMQMKFKPKIEIAEEVAIDNVLKMNDFLDVKHRFNKDQVELGVGFVKHEYLHGEGIRIKYVDPQTTIHSYTEDPFFQDVFYWGEVVKMHVTELKKIKPGITKIEIDRLSKLGSSWADEYTTTSPYLDGMFDRETVNVLFFNYKTDKNFVHKKKKMPNGGYRATRRDESFNPEEGNEMFSRIDKTIDVWYEGALVLGTDELLKWELSKNMARPDSAFQKSYSNYIGVAPKIYKGGYDSIADRLKPVADMIQLTHLKIQQVLQKIVPDGVYIDADGLTGINLGDGGVYSPQKALEMFFATGSVIGRSSTEDGEYNHGKVPITQLNNSAGVSKLSSLFEVYNSYMVMMADLAGLNSASGASSPDPRSLVGVQKLAALNSNKATKHILEAGLFMTRELCENISIRIGDVLKYSDDRAEFANQIGRYNVSILDHIKNLHLHSFGIYIEISPDEEEKAALETEIQIALKSGSIDLEDAIDIRQISNIKMANEMLKLRRKRKLKVEKEAEEFKMKAQEASNIRSSQAAAQAKMQAIEAEKASKIEVLYAEAEMKIKTITHEVASKKELMAEEYKYNMSLEGARTKAKAVTETEKEDRKDKRVDKQSTQQSEMITQRQAGTPAKNFESTEDTLDGIGMEEFG